MLPQNLQQQQVSTSPQLRMALIAGAIAGPLYVGVGTLEAVLRDGFDIRIHSLSLLANGPGGWIHSTMMVVSGLLTVIGALGVSTVQQRTGRRSYAMIIGLVIYGLGIATAGLLRADPAEGFPIGTPPGPPVVVTASGVGHLVAGGIGFLGLIVACLACARRSARAGDRRLGRLLSGDRRLLSRRLRRYRFRSRQSRDQHRLHSCSRARVGMADSALCPGAQRKESAEHLGPRSPGSHQPVSASWHGHDQLHPDR